MESSDINELLDLFLSSNSLCPCSSCLQVPCTRAHVPPSHMFPLKCILQVPCIAARPTRTPEEQEELLRWRFELAIWSLKMFEECLKIRFSPAWLIFEVWVASVTHICPVFVSVQITVWLTLWPCKEKGNFLIWYLKPTSPNAIVEACLSKQENQQFRTSPPCSNLLLRLVLIVDCLSTGFGTIQ